MKSEEIHVGIDVAKFRMDVAVGSDNAPLLIMHAHASGRLGRTSRSRPDRAPARARK